MAMNADFLQSSVNTVDLSIILIINISQILIDSSCYITVLCTYNRLIIIFFSFVGKSTILYYT